MTYRRRINLEKRRLARAKRTPLVYFMTCQEFVKLGWTTDPYQRLMGSQVGNPHLIELPAMMRGGEREERILHREFKQYHHRAEWFRNEGDLKDLLDAIRGMEPIEARDHVGEWYLNRRGKSCLLLPVALEGGLHCNADLSVGAAP
ncbi:MAG: GIY-YIG nuclease family protein [Hyphomicrobiales bacterium]|nr:GIY-YIG nuclease family protein [Hyphomicrobiales bacterium]